MSVVGFTFGSFGDIITLIQLANTVRRSLSEARGSVADCEGLLSYLDGFSRSLEIVKMRLEPYDAPGSQGTSFSPIATLSPLEAQVVLRHVEACYKVLNKFNITLEPYVGMVDQRPVRSFRKKFRWFCRKLRWVTVKSEAADVERRLTALTTSIMIVLQAASLPRDQALAPGPGLYLTDLLDCTTFVPIQLCTSFKIFHDYLRVLFQERKGKAFVYSGKYRLFMRDSGRLVTSARWEQYIRSGQRVLMSALVVSAPNKCPNVRCQAQNVTVTTSSSNSPEIQCTSCNTWYRHLAADETHQNPLQDDMVGRPLPRSLAPQTTIGEDSADDHDISFVRRMIAYSDNYGKRPVRAGNAARKGRRELFTCETCSKTYKHVSALVKHRWEHSPQWRDASKALLSKHQQIQLIEAAAILSHLAPAHSDVQSHPEDRSLWPSFLSSSLPSALLSDKATERDV